MFEIQIVSVPGCGLAFYCKPKQRRVCMRSTNYKGAVQRCHGILLCVVIIVFQSYIPEEVNHAKLKYATVTQKLLKSALAKSC